MLPPYPLRSAGGGGSRRRTTSVTPRCVILILMMSGWLSYKKKGKSPTSRRELRAKKSGRRPPRASPRVALHVRPALRGRATVHRGGVLRSLGEHGSHAPRGRTGPLANKFIYRFTEPTEPERGDIVVFRARETDGGEVNLVKRVLGLPEDEVAARNGVLFLNGVPQEEPYLNQDPADKEVLRPDEGAAGVRLRHGGQPGPLLRLPLFRPRPGGEHRRRGIPSRLAAEPARIDLGSPFAAISSRPLCGALLLRIGAEAKPVAYPTSTGPPD